MVVATAYKDEPTVTRLTLLALFASSLVVADMCDECREDDSVCCNGDCFYGSSCLGLSCSSDLDCSDGQSCCSNTCVTGLNCVGKNCSSDIDCSYNESCCSEKCKSGHDCIGVTCSTDSDCGSEKCCEGNCASYCWGVDYVTVIFFILMFTLPALFVLVIVFSVLAILWEKLTECLRKPNRDRPTETCEPSAPPHSVVQDLRSVEVSASQNAVHGTVPTGWI